MKTTKALYYIFLLIILAPAYVTAKELTPVVIFPAFHFTILEVKVRNQTTAPECPAFGTFEDWFPNPAPSTEFNQVCRDKLLTLNYKSNSDEGFEELIENVPGVKVRIKHYGSTQSAPFYEPLYTFLENNGYERDVNIRIAGYDSRMTPDLHGFLRKTMSLIEETYYQNHKTPVHIVGHSNGPLYAQYLLTHTTQAWKNKYIHGFTPIAGNWPGQGLLYALYFTGLNVIDFSFPTAIDNAVSSATMFQSHPSSYMSSADPAIFGNSITVIHDDSTSTTYTPLDNQQLFSDAALPAAQILADKYIGLVKFTPPDFPNVDVYAEKGSGFETVVGLSVKNLTTGQLLDETTQFFTRPDGDANQEDITNDAISVWADMPCFRFELNDNPYVDHFALTSDTAVLERLLSNLQRSKSTCP